MEYIYYTTQQKSSYNGVRHLILRWEDFRWEFNYIQDIQIVWWNITSSNYLDKLWEMGQTKRWKCNDLPEET